MVVCPTCSLSKQVMSLVTTSTTALRGAATSLELAERRRGSTLSTRFLLCTARRSVDRLQTKVRAQSDGLAARNHSRWVHFRKISSADAEKRRGKTKKHHRQGGGTQGGGGILPKRWLSQPALFPVAKPGHSGRAKWQSKWQTPDYRPTTCLNTLFLLLLLLLLGGAGTGSGCCQRRRESAAAAASAGAGRGEGGVCGGMRASDIDGVDGHWLPLLPPLLQH